MKSSYFFPMLGETIFPAGCVLCKSSPSLASEAFYGICDQCRRLLIPELGKRCSRCGRPLVSEEIICMDCRTIDVPSFDFCRVLFPYSGKSKEFLSEYKYGTGRRAASFIAELFCQEIEDLGKFQSNFDGIVPVPPRPGKIRTKGWDQIEMIVRRMGIASGLPVKRCLSRLSSKVQKELGRVGRLHNLDGRIRCVAPPPLHALLIDDVMTTGATLNECSKILKNGGTLKVVALALCYD